MATLKNIEFVTTVAATCNLPPPCGAEVAFVGRSNAGKSSAINALAQRKRMAFVSKTPGRTQHINFFRVGTEQYLVDLPGYGYAAVPAAARAHWNELIGSYIQSRPSLRGIILIMDARRPMTVLDEELFAWVKPTGTPIHILLSKADKLTRRQADETLRRVDHVLHANYGNCSVQLFSSPKKTGIPEAAEIIRNWLDHDDNKQPPVKGNKPGAKP